MTTKVGTILLLAAIWAVLFPLASVTAALRADTTSTSTCGFDHGYVALLSSSTRDGERGWLLCFDIDSKKGWVYHPPTKIDLMIQKVESSTILKLSSTHSNGPLYVLDLSVNGTSLQGTLVLRSTAGDSATETFAVRGYRLSRPLGTPGYQLSGWYSNVKFNKDAGDPVGAEVLLFISSSKKTGLVRFNESYWGEPEFVPLVLSKIRIVSGHKIEFELNLADGNGARYSAILKGTALILQRRDIASDPQAGPILLQRQPTLLP